MGQKIGIVSPKHPGNIDEIISDQGSQEFFWFAEIQAAIAFLLGSSLDRLFIDEDLLNSDQDFLSKHQARVLLLNSQLRMEPIKLRLEERPQARPRKIVFFAEFETIMGAGLIKTCFQPIVAPNQAHQAFFGFECLSRISYGECVYSPDFIFGYAQEKLKLPDYDKKCLAEALRCAPHKPSAQIFLNIRPQTLMSHDFLPWLSHEIASSKLDKNQLVMEITEQHSAFNENEVKEQCQQLRALGLRLAMDDFGIGLSNLGMLEVIEPDFIKVAGRFVKNIHQNVSKQKIIKNVIELARDFNIKAIVENVEQEKEWLMAQSLGAELAQGYYFFKPLDSPTLSALI